MKVAALILILAGGVVQAGGAMFAVIAKGPVGHVPWATLAGILVLGAALLVAGLLCLGRRATHR